MLKRILASLTLILLLFTSASTNASILTNDSIFTIENITKRSSSEIIQLTNDYVNSHESDYNNSQLMNLSILKSISDKASPWDTHLANQIFSDQYSSSINRNAVSIVREHNTNAAKKIMYELLYEKIIQDSISFHDIVIEPSKGSKIVSITIEYEYRVQSQRTRVIDDRAVTKRYYYEFQNCDGAWLLTSQWTDDPWLSKDLVENSDIPEVKTIVEDIMHVSNNSMDIELMEVPINNEAVAPDAAPPDRIISYDVNKAVNYAIANYNNKTNSPFWYSTSSTNCQNFVSQAVFMGLNGNTNQKIYIPAVSTQRLGTTNKPNVWCPQQSSTYYSYYYYNWSWDSVQGFANLINTNGPTREGPYGSIAYSTSISSAAKGNILHINYEGAASISNVDHAMFITDVTGTSGNRSMSNIKIAAHTAHTNSAKQLLSEYMASHSGITSANFLRITISGGRYVSSSNYN